MQTMNVRRVCVSKTCLVRTPLRNTKYIIIIIIIVWRRRRTLCADKPRRQRFSTNSIPAPSERYRRYYRVIYTRLCCSTTFFFFFYWNLWKPDERLVVMTYTFYVLFRLLYALQFDPNWFDLRHNDRTRMRWIFVFGLCLPGSSVTGVKLNFVFSYF